MRRSVLVSVAVLALSLVALPIASADVSCDPLSTGAIEPPSSVSMVEIVAPAGQLIDEVCLVTEGSLVPTHLVVDPLVPSLVLDGEGGPITQYSASFVVAPQASTDEPDVFIAPQPATVSAGGGGAASDGGLAAPFSLLALGVMAFAAATTQFVIGHRRSSHSTRR